MSEAEVLCPICCKLPADTETRKDARGRYWCKPCLDEFDGIDWEEYYESRCDPYRVRGKVGGRISWS